MKKIICIPDSFKGTMDSKSICNIMEQAIYRHIPDAQVISIPVADGGEGSVDAFLHAVGGEKIFATVKGPYLVPMTAYYGILEGNIAIIEMASCAGLPLVQEDKRPDQTSTYGVGELIIDALKRGCKKVIVGLGGSATNDGGCGAAVAVGTIFYNEQHQPFIPTGGTLKDIRRIDQSQQNPLLKGIEIVTMCDIDNPLYGEHGAAYIFGPQKGANDVMVARLDAGLHHLSNCIKSSLTIDVSTLPGGGAAGGMGAGMMAFFNSQLQMGIETILDVVNFDGLLENTDLVFTGEGKLDAQSLRGKVPIGVGRRAKQAQVPVIAVVGALEDEISLVYEEGITAVFSINPAPVDYAIAKYRAQQNLAITMDNIIRMLAMLKK